MALMFAMVWIVSVRNDVCVAIQNTVLYETAFWPVVDLIEE